MIPTVLPGDYGIVNKWKIGARLFDIPAAIDGRKVNVCRLPGYGRIERNDIAVLNYPLTGGDTVGMNMHKYYCKRIVALPGDSLSIVNCHYTVKGSDEPLGYVSSQDELEWRFSHTANTDEYVCANAWPYDSVMGWTIRNFGPLLVPAKGTRINMTREHTLLYGRYIAWEQQCDKPVWRDGRAMIGNEPIDEYTFTENYYFTAGDRADNSADSRYWGLLPEPMIVGVAAFIWDSVDHTTGKRRWHRIFRDL